MMIKAGDGGDGVTVTFSLPFAVAASHAAICGEWNDWSPTTDVMDRNDEGFVRTIRLQAGRVYRFRYLLDGQRWENDWAADRYVPNGYGSDDSVVDLTERAGRPVAPPVPTVDPSPPEPSSSSSSRAFSSSIEREAKLVAPAALGLPDLDGLVPGTRAITQPVQRLDATYYDTEDLRLARSGITVRHRGGESGPAWTVKLPEAGPESDLVRREIRFDGRSDQVPHSAADLVLAFTRSGSLVPVARLTTVRRPIEIRDAKGRLLAEVVDDTVSVVREGGPVGRFREVEVELHTNSAKGRRVRHAALTRLVDAGCTAETPMPKLVRALGEPANLPPDVVVPPLPEGATVIDLVRHSVARSVGQIIRHDPGARLGDDEEEVHKFRVATRRLRSDLHSFAPVLDETRIDPIRAELSWLGGMIGAVRDTDVLTRRLTTRLGALSECDAQGAQHLLRILERECRKARVTMMAGLQDARYLRLLDVLVALAAAPPFLDAGPLGRASRKMATNIMRKPWRRVVDAVSALGEDPSDAKLHAVRILAKRSRYAAEATAPLLGPGATRFAAGVADVQTVLGDHQDTVLAEEWLLRAGAASPQTGQVVRQLIASEQSRRRVLRSQWPAVWQRAVTRKLP